VPAQQCQAIVDDWERLKVHAPRQRLSMPGDKPCSRRATEPVEHLHLCSTHARMAREGLVMETGRVANKEDIRNVHRYPRSFPRGLYHWAQKR
jgi:hypothetical protein